MQEAVEASSPSPNFHTLAPKLQYDGDSQQGSATEDTAAPCFSSRPQTTSPRQCQRFFSFLNHTTDKTQSGGGSTDADKAEIPAASPPACPPVGCSAHFPCVPTVPLYHLRRQRSEVSKLILGPGGSRDAAANRGRMR